MRDRIKIQMAGSFLSRGLRKLPQALPKNGKLALIQHPKCPHGYEAQESEWLPEAKRYRVRRCLKCTLPQCLHGHYLTEEEISLGVKQSSDCPVCFPPIFSESSRAWNTTLSQAGFGYGRGMSMVEEVETLADGSVKISGYSKNLCTGGGSKDMELNDVKAEFGSNDVGPRSEDDFDEENRVDDLNDPISLKSESAQHREAISNSISDTGPCIRHEISKIAKGRYGITENGKLIREFTSRAAASRHLKKVKAEISAELKHNVADLDYELQQTAVDVDGSR